MKIKIFRMMVLFLLIISLRLYSEKLVFPHKNSHGLGHIGHQIEIEIALKVDGDKITGFYMYKKYMKPIKLKGLIKNREIILNEYSANNIKKNILIKGKLGNDLILKGTLTNTQNGRVYKLYIDFSKKYTYRKIEKKNKFDSIKKDIPFFFNLGDIETEAKINRSIKKISDKICRNTLQSKEDIRKMKKDNPGIKLYLPHHCNMIGEVELANNSIISVMFSFEGFSGGAHGWYGYKDYNFDLEEKRVLKITDLFKSESEISKILFLELSGSPQMRNCGDSVLNELKKKMDIKSTDFNHFVRFSISQIGLEMVVQYILPHSIGSHLKHRISWDKLSIYLKPRFSTLFK